MPAQSKAQQRLFGLVRAVQKGDAKAPNLAISRMAKDIDTKDVKHMASTSTKGLPDRKDESMGGFGQLHQQYNEYGKLLNRQHDMRSIAEQLAKISEMVEQQVMSESDDWYDGHTIKRNMKEMKGYASDFSKLAQESDMMYERMTALYQDMGRVMERYAGLYKERENTNEPPSPTPEPFRGDNVDKEPSSDPAPQIHEEPEYRPDPVKAEVRKKVTEIESRLLDHVRGKLSETQAQRFNKLPFNKQLEMAIRTI